MGRIIQRVIENLKLDIRNIHISFIEKEYSFGVKLDSLQCLTINENGVEEFLDRTVKKNETLVKKITIENFGVYWNSSKV